MKTEKLFLSEWTSKPSWISSKRLIGCIELGKHHRDRLVLVYGHIQAWSRNVWDWLRFTQPPYTLSALRPLPLPGSLSLGVPPHTHRSDSLKKTSPQWSSGCLHVWLSQYWPVKNRTDTHSFNNTELSKSIGTVIYLLLFWLCTPALWILNDKITTRSKCRYQALIWGYFHPYWVNRLEITPLFVHSPPSI